MFKFMFNNWVSLTPEINYGTYCMEAIVNYPKFTGKDIIETDDIPF